MFNSKIKNNKKLILINLIFYLNFYFINSMDLLTRRKADNNPDLNMFIDADCAQREFLENNKDNPGIDLRILYLLSSVTVPVRSIKSSLCDRLGVFAYQLGYQQKFSDHIVKNFLDKHPDLTPTVHENIFKALNLAPKINIIKVDKTLDSYTKHCHLQGIHDYALEQEFSTKEEEDE